MKKRIISLLLGAVLALGVFALCSCEKKSDAEELIGTWRTDNMGYYTITTFTADGKLRSDYGVSDASKCEAMGLNEEVLDSMDNEIFYKSVTSEELTEEEKNAANGQSAIKTYMTREDMDADENGAVSYYSVKDGTLTIDGCVYTRAE